MKRFAFILLVAFSFAGCHNQSSVPDVASLETEYVSESESTGYFGFEDELSAEEKQILSELMPVLTEGKTFMAAHMPSGGESVSSFNEKNIAGILEDIDPEYWDADYSSDKLIRSVAFCGAAGDGRKELAVMLDHPAGFYCLLHKDGEDIYGVYMPVRRFEELRENGVFLGSGGAETAYYERLHFEDGAFSTEILGYADMGYYEANGKEVSQEEFEERLDGLLGEKVIWHGISE